ncbi:MAG: UDP-N-acetylmuramoyl-L-alanine--D-glutamate ligase [Oscillospiraceae bacterium]|jgi:UDP-N-acetylmuramoylalanine--D-glutamate ligase|nr:UDP-N-acetylmuramoyl-L-alanine--D-glutamate ligase [Oscillospiraceae bacterium]
MKDALTTLTRDKDVLLLGYGREGRSTFRLLSGLGVCKRLDVADINPLPLLPSGSAAVSGEGYMDNLGDYDIVFLSPGVALPQPPEKYGCRFCSQTEVFLGVYGERTAGVTGTKGKSTVSSMLRHALRAAGRDCLLAGNIGVPLLDAAETAAENTVFVAELSCHQLEYCPHSPRIAALLNLYEDHLDRYVTMERYAAAKANIYLRQTPDGILFCASELADTLKEHAGRVVFADKCLLPPGSADLLQSRRLLGEHNLRNCAFAHAMSLEMGVSQERFLASLESFSPLPHRLEYFTTKDGVDYYNDSVSTTAESAIYAVRSVPGADILLLGGLDRGIDYSPLLAFLPQSGLSHVILMYQSGRRIYRELSCANIGSLQAHYAADLAAAVTCAATLAKPGTACVLSPAAASYDAFTDFAERGETFKRLVTNLTAT